LKFSTSLKKNHEFRRLYASGKSVSSQYAVVYCRKNRSASNRVGLTVSTKLGTAVCRNKIRRRYREIYRINEEKFDPGYDIVIVPRSKSKLAPFRVLETDFISLMRKLGVCRSET
jgi:ribonuclease P protein component